MNVESVAFPALSVDLPQASRASSGVTGDFAYWMGQELTQVNDKLLQADELVRKLALGEVDNVHQVMIALDQARLSFQLLTQVRNKLLDSYQDILRMSV